MTTPMIGRDIILPGFGVGHRSMSLQAIKAIKKACRYSCVCLCYSHCDIVHVNRIMIPIIKFRAESVEED